MGSTSAAPGRGGVVLGGCGGVVPPQEPHDARRKRAPCRPGESVQRSCSGQRRCFCAGRVGFACLPCVARNVAAQAATRCRQNSSARQQRPRHSAAADPDKTAVSLCLWPLTPGRQRRGPGPVSARAQIEGHRGGIAFKVAHDGGIYPCALDAQSQCGLGYRRGSPPRPHCSEAKLSFHPPMTETPAPGSLSSLTVADPERSYRLDESRCHRALLPAPTPPREALPLE